MNNLNVPKNTYLSKDEIALENNIHKIESLTNDTVYWHMLSKIIKQPTAIDRWISQFPFLHDTDFELFFLLPCIVLRDTRLQTFQYKIINQIISCRAKLKTWKIVENDNCLYCDEFDDIM